MKKLTFNRNVVVPIVYIGLAILLIVVTGIALARYNESIQLSGLVSTTGDMLASVEVDISPSYIENNVVYFYITITNTENGDVSKTDVDYSVTVSNQAGSLGIFYLIDEDGNTSSEDDSYADVVTSKTYSFSNEAEEKRKLKVFVKTTDGLGKNVKFNVKLNAEQKNME